MVRGYVNAILAISSASILLACTLNRGLTFIRTLLNREFEKIKQKSIDRQHKSQTPGNTAFQFLLFTQEFRVFRRAIVIKLSLSRAPRAVQRTRDANGTVN